MTQTSELPGFSVEYTSTVLDPSPVRGLKEKKVKWKRAEGVEGPSPGPVFGGNGRALMGSKGPYLLPGEILIPGFNRPVQSQAVNWATAGLLADPPRFWPAFPAARRRQQPQTTWRQHPDFSMPPFRPSIMCSSWMQVSVHAHWHLTTCDEFSGARHVADRSVLLN